MPGWAASTSSEATESPAPPLLARLCRGVRSSWWRGGRPAQGHGHLAKHSPTAPSAWLPASAHPSGLTPPHNWETAITD